MKMVKTIADRTCISIHSLSQQLNSGKKSVFSTPINAKV